MRSVVVVCLVALFLLPQAARADFPACNPDYYSSFDTRLPDTHIPPGTGPCRGPVDAPLVPLDGGTALRFIVEPDADHRRDNAVAVELRAVAEQANVVMRSMPELRIGNVTVLLTHLNRDDGVFAASHPAGGPGTTEDGVPTDCLVTVYLPASTDMDEARIAFAHELFHCMQYETWWRDLAGPDTGIAAQWWVEGSAEYFANVVIHGNSFSNSRATDFEGHRGDPLTSKNRGLAKYEPVVFFYWLGQVRGQSSLASFLGAMARGLDTTELEQQAALRAQVPLAQWLEFEQTYIDDRLRKPDGSNIGVTPSPGPMRTISTSTEYPVAPGLFSVSASQITFARGHIYRVERPLDPPSVMIHGSENNGPWSDPPATVDACSEARTFRQVSGAVENPNHAQVRITVVDDDRACCPETGSLASGFKLVSDPSCPDEPPPETGGGGRSFGEPHLVTFDGYGYSCQLAGEFVLTRGRGSFEVQTRQEEVPPGGISANTAVAIRVGSHRLAVYAHAFPGIPIDTSRLYWDGKPVAITGSRAFDGARVQARSSYGYDITLASGHKIIIAFFEWRGIPYLDVEVNVPKTSRGAYTGLLGDFDGSPRNDLRTRDGKIVTPNGAAYEPFKGPLSRFIPGGLPLDALASTYFDEMYRSFGPSWRVTNAESLFDYGPGQNTASFTKAGIPKIVTLGGIDPAAVDAARRTCAAAQPPPETMNGCIFDVAVTGDNGFARALGQIGEELRRRGEDELRRRVPLPGLPDIPRVPIPGL